jgi:hypothetical protein
MRTSGNDSVQGHIALTLKHFWTVMRCNDVG